MFFIILGFVCIFVTVIMFRKMGFNWDILFLNALLFLCFIVLGTIADWGHEEFIKKEEIKIYQYSNSDRYVKVSKDYYYLNIDKSEEYNVEYDSIKEVYISRDEAEVYEQDDINTPVVVKYTAKPKKNFFTFGLRDDDEMYRIYIPKGTIGIK